METATRTSRTGTRHHHRPAAALSEKRNRAYIEDGEVKWDIVTEDMSIEEAKELTLKVVELEYPVAAQPSKDGNKKAGTWQTKANGTTPTASMSTR